jgi:hypothetical protein
VAFPWVYFAPIEGFRAQSHASDSIASLVLPTMIHLSGDGHVLVVQGAMTDTVSKHSF